MNGRLVEFGGLSYTIVGRSGDGYYLLQCNYYGTIWEMHPDSEWLKE